MNAVPHAHAERMTFSMGGELVLHVCTGMSPREADVAFASISRPPVPGSLSDYVLSELAVNEDDLPSEQELGRGFVLRHTPAGVPVIFVVTFSMAHSATSLGMHLNTAMRALRDTLRGQRIWMPLLGTEATWIPDEVSLALSIEVIHAHRHEFAGSSTTFYLALPPDLDAHRREMLAEHAAIIMEKLNSPVRTFAASSLSAGQEELTLDTISVPMPTYLGLESMGSHPGSSQEALAEELPGPAPDEGRAPSELYVPAPGELYAPAPGEHIGQYELLQELGRGGSGAVFLARDTKLLRRVAIKFLLKRDTDLAERFKLEARATARCRHDSIVVIHDISEHRGLPYLVLEHLEGQTLRELMGGFRLGLGYDSGDPRPRLLPQKAVELVIPIVRALAAAHAEGIAHRDLKPENIVVTDTGSVKVLDFGIAKLFEPEGGWRTTWLMAPEMQRGQGGGGKQGAADVRRGQDGRDGQGTRGERVPLALTRNGVLLGTVPYMAPEQWDAESDHRSDIWAVGIILYELLAGHHPLAPLSLERLIEITNFERPMPSLRQAMPELGALAGIVDECLIKEKDARLASATRLLDLLSRYLAEAGGPRAPSYPDDATRELAKKLEMAHARKRRLEQAGENVSAVVDEILSLKRALRQGGQLKAGDSLGGGRYLLLGQIGRGGFAQVWEALDERRGERVAIKVLHSEIAGDRLRRDRFFRGARIMAELNHEAIVRVMDPYGEDDGYYYFVMELVSGKSLAHAAIDKRIEPEQVTAIALGVGSALGQAHRRGYVHRDVKPDNILVTEAGLPKLTDFDLVAADDTTGGTRTGAMGTFLYAPPEMLERPQEADQSADVYGLAMTMVFMLYGDRLPLTILRNAESFVDRLSATGELKQVLKTALSWDVRHRFRDADAFCEALRAALSLPRASTQPGASALADAVPAHVHVHVQAPPMQPDLAHEALAGVAPMRFVSVPSGEFLMGSPKTETMRHEDEGPQRHLAVTGFALAVCPVTQEQWQAVMRAEGGDRARGDGDVPMQPVQNVSWVDALLFLNALSEREGLLPCYDLKGDRFVWHQERDSYRLPTEAEWEYACRAGSDGAYCFGSDEELLGEYAWFGPNAGGSAQPVGMKRPNAWGLCDMHGNVWEWCWDSYWHCGKEVRASLERRSMRGGAFGGTASDMRCARRHWSRLKVRVTGVGFRVARGPYVAPVERREGQGK